jgi:hypothetical protein
MKRLGVAPVPLPTDRGLELPPPIQELLFGLQFLPDRLFQSAGPDAYPSHRQFYFAYLSADPDAITWVFAHPQAIAVVVFSITQQQPSAWIFEIEVRPFRETW